MKITFLGTGTSQGVPIIGSDHPVCLSIDKRDKRLRVSVLIQWKDINMVIDCGPDFRQQMLLNNVKKIASNFFILEESICCLKSGPQSITILKSFHWIKTETLSLLSLLSRLKQTGWLLPIIGTPWEVPVPKKVIFNI